MTGKQSLGIIETRGFTSAIKAADAMMKAAYIEIAGIEKTGSGLVAITIVGDVGSVKAAIETGAEAAQYVGELVAVHVIPKPYNGLEKVLPVLDNKGGA